MTARERRDAPNSLGSADAGALRRLADVARHRVHLRHLGPFIQDWIEATLVEPPAVARMVAPALRRLFSDMPAVDVAAFLRDEARRLDEVRAD